MDLAPFGIMPSVDSFAKFHVVLRSSIGLATPSRYTHTSSSTSRVTIFREAKFLHSYSKFCEPKLHFDHLGESFTVVLLYFCIHEVVWEDDIFVL
jgi:hypothetical protein